MNWPDWYIIQDVGYTWSRSTLYLNGEFYYQMFLYRSNLLIAVITAKERSNAKPKSNDC